MNKIICLTAALLINLCVFAGGYKVGDIARDFSLKNIDGKMVSMKDMKNAKGIILVFTCNHCPFAKAYEQRIIELDKKYSSKNYPVVAVNPNDADIVPEDSYDNMIKNAAEKGFTFPYLYDQSQEIATAYGATRTPHVFVLQKEKDKFVVKYIGAIDNNSEEADKADKKYVQDAVDALLNNKEIPVTETKAIGCGIKWKKTNE
jgi:peroxiredoxin